MKINPTPKNKPNFTGFLNNKVTLNALEKIADHSASFTLGASFLGAMALRPLAISLTPKTNKENKKYASLNSISSATAKLLIAETIALPVENAIKKINENPKNFLNKDTFENFYSDKKSYNFLTQTIKQSANIISALPKSYLTVALIPILADKFFNKKEKKETINPMIFQGGEKFSSFQNISFQSKKIGLFESGVSKLINSETLQNFSKNHSSNAANITRNFSILGDVLLTGASIFHTKKSKKIKEERKNPLIYNNLLSTAFSILFGCGLDKLIQKGTKKSIENFKLLNKNNPKLNKYIDGINVLRPTVAFALVYYGILPVITTYFADKIDENLNQKKSEL